jgi:predicted nucleic acid-binding protein
MQKAFKYITRLKRIRKSIQFPDLIIAATSRSLNLPSTINERHFKDIEGLDLITPSFFES